MTDHVSILCKLNLTKPPPLKRQISYRKLKEIDHEAFSLDIQKSFSHIDSSADLNEIVHLYNKSLHNILDSHAPLKSCKITIRPSNPWYSPEIDEAKKLRKRLERKWRKSKLEVDRQIFTAQRQLVYNMIYEAKTTYYRDKISNCTDQKQLFKIVESLLHQKGKAKLPSHNSKEQLAQKFNNFFVSKITKIRNDLDSESTDTVNQNSAFDNEHDLTSYLEVFTPASEEEICKIIRASPPKSCDSDPIPTWILKKHLHLLVPLITRIVNLSLESAVFPSCFKSAMVTPLLKKPSLDSENLKNYRPVSNLAFISKIIEKVVSSRIAHHLASNKLYEHFQSAYRKYHGTETALLRVQNDILYNIDHKRGVYLVLLDLSAAFDTIDHSILLSRLSAFGVRGSALEWIRSYLTDRMQAVNINGCLSSFLPLLFGVPQGSVLGPQFFTIYSSPIATIARKHGLQVHMYADDTQLYLSFDLDSVCDEIASRSRIELCIKDIKSWMTLNKLKLNDDKTEFIIITSKYHQSKPTTDCLQIASANIHVSPNARNLGIVFDKTLSMEDQIKNMCKSAYFQIRNINQIRKVLDDDTAATLVHALVTSRLDFGNALLYGITERQLNKLQQAQNAAARMLTRTRKFDHISPVLQRLHWLPIRYRIHFKLLLLTWKALHDMAPSYISELLNQHIPSRYLRSSDKHLLSVPRTFSSYGDRAFYASAPRLWNSLPLDLRLCNSLGVFKKSLKTHLFKTAYDN